MKKVSIRATGTRHSISAPLLCLGNWPWPEPMAACATSWHVSVASMFWSSMTGPWHH
jgi:hypothetical protein